MEVAAADPRTSEIMLANRFTLLDASTLPRLLPTCAERGVRVVVAAVFASGLLARPEPAGHFDYAEAPPEVVEQARAVAAVCREHGTDLPTAALHYVARHPAVTRVCFGARTPTQLRQTLERVAAAPPEALWADLAERGLAPDPAVTSPEERP